MLRSIGLISRNDNPYRQDPAGPEMRDPERADARPVADRVRPLSARGRLGRGGVPAAAERYRHALLSAPGSAAADAPWPPAHAGRDALRLAGDAVTLTSLRRRDEGWLEARVVNLAADPRSAELRGGIDRGA